LNPKLFLVANIESKFSKNFDPRMVIACYLLLFKELGKNLSKYDIGIMLTSDQTIGCQKGTNYLLEEKGYKPSFAFIPDAGNDWHIEEISKGILQLKLTSKVLN
jgi:acetylornithine deacetylase/succinyl-diaminopimelate desuccinylase-like protein